MINLTQKVETVMVHNYEDVLIAFNQLACARKAHIEDHSIYPFSHTFLWEINIFGNGSSIVALQELDCKLNQVS